MSPLSFYQTVEDERLVRVARRARARHREGQALLAAAHTSIDLSIPLTPARDGVARSGLLSQEPGDAQTGPAGMPGRSPNVEEES